jgi:hypothetical protein
MIATTLTTLTRQRIGDTSCALQPHASNERRAMRIGEPLRTIVVEPLELPVNAPATEPDPNPPAPRPEPEKEPVTV